MICLVILILSLLLLLFLYNKLQICIALARATRAAVSACDRCRYIYTTQKLGVELASARTMSTSDSATVAGLTDAVQRLSREAARLQLNLERVHQLQRVLAAVTQQWIEEMGKPDTNNIHKNYYTMPTQRM